MNASLLDLLMPRGTNASNRIYGVVAGIVTNNQDPEGLGRVRVRFPWLSEEDESWWARIAAPMAGPDRGVYFLPEVDDRVLVAFEHGDVRFPYIIGALWTADQKPPETNDDGKNNKRTLKSRSGHLIRLDDTDGAEKIEIIDKSNKNSIVINTADNTITITADADIKITSSGGKLELGGKDVEITSQAGLKIHASGTMDITSDAQLNIKGSMVNIN